MSGSRRSPSPPQELEDFQTEPSAEGARRVVRSVWVPTIPKPFAGARSQPAEGNNKIMLIMKMFLLMIIMFMLIIIMFMMIIIMFMLMLIRFMLIMIMFMLVMLVKKVSS